MEVIIIKIPIQSTKKDVKNFFKQTNDNLEFPEF